MPGRLAIVEPPSVSVEAALADLRAGRPVVLAVRGEGEGPAVGYVVVAAERVTPQSVAFMAAQARGLVCVCLTAEDCARLGLPPMPRRGDPVHGAAFAVSVEARDGVASGISAEDRARTIQVAADPSSQATDLVRPGHVFPLEARDGGVLVRPGEAEAAVDLARLAGLRPAGAVCAVLGPDGDVASPAELPAFALRHGLALLDVEQLADYRRGRERLLRRVAAAPLATNFGEFRAVAYEERVTGRRHVALVKGDISALDVLVSIHNECLPGDVFRSQACDCGRRLEAALATVEAEGAGVVVYLGSDGDRLECGAGGGLWPAAQVLAELGVTSIRALDSDAVAELESGGVVVAPYVDPRRVPLAANA